MDEIIKGDTLIEGIPDIFLLAGCVGLAIFAIVIVLVWGFGGGKKK